MEVSTGSTNTIQQSIFSFSLSGFSQKSSFTTTSLCGAIPEKNATPPGFTEAINAAVTAPAINAA